jgi:tetratricopeptide (TPR) repeat protein
MAWACRLRAEVLDAQDRSGVEEAYRDWLSFSESLATQFPANVVYQIDLARCQSGLGGLMAKGKRDDEAEQMFRNALAVLEPKEPSGWTLERRRLKAMVLSNQGEFRRASQRPGAEASLRESIKIAQELASRRPVTRDDLQFLAIAQNNLAEILDVQSDLEAAIKLFGESIGALERLAAEVPTAIDTQSYLGYVAEQQGKLLAKTNRPAEAKLALDKAVSHQKQAVNLSGGRAPAYREMLAGHLRLLADTCLVLGAYDDAMRAVVDLPKYVPQQGQGYFDAAKILARCVNQVENDDNLTPARRDEISRKYLGRTVVMLREALDSDPKLSESMKADPGLKGLFDRPEVKELRVLFFPSVF